MIYLALILFLSVPLIELYILFEVSSLIGFGQTVVLVLLTGLFGAEVIRREGYHVLRKIQNSVSASEISRNMIEGGLLVVSGLFLLTPGILTDIFGLMLVYRPFRERLIPLIVERIKFSGEFEVRTF